jgi:hypothetical protein
MNKRLMASATLAGIALMTGRPAAAQDAAANTVALDQRPDDDSIRLFRKNVRSLLEADHLRQH